MLLFNYYMSRLISKMRVPAIKNSSIDDNAFVDSGCVIIDSSLGRYSYLNENCNIFGARIGSFTSIGSNCQMGGGKHSTVFASTSPVFSDGNNCFHKSFSKNRWDKADEVVIGNDVWIGTGCYVKSGVVIGDGAIIGAHAVVTHDVEPYTIVGGVPAQFIRYRFNEEHIEKLLKLKWWDWSEKKLKEYGDCFDSPEHLLECFRED